jgi:CRP/FNR family cyclic AMP-dependent transcriptional regulator
VENIAWLKEVMLFKDIPEEDLEEISGLLEERKYDANVEIYEENSPGGSLYIIKKGKVKVIRKSDQGKEHGFAHLSEGDIFGELSFLQETPHTATIESVADCEVLVLDKQRFDGLAHTNPKVAYLITRNLLLILEAIVRKMNADYISLMEYIYVFGK